MATILRHKRRRDFTVLPNGMLRDPRLSFRACGLLAYLLMLPGGEGVDSTSLSERKYEGRDAIRAAFRELEAAGYATRRKVQDELGHWVTEVEVSDETEDGFPGVGEPTTGLPTSDNQALKASKNYMQRTEGGARTRADGATFLPGSGWLGGKAS